MIYLLGGYMWLYIHRPFEYWTWLGDIQIERIYMLAVMLVWLFTPGKGWCANRTNKALLFFTISILFCWIASYLPSYLGEHVVEEHFKVGVMFVLMVTTINSEKKLKQALLFFFFALFMYQFHSFYEFCCGRYEYRQHTIRMNAINKTHGDPNTFSAMLLYAVPFLIPFWATARAAKVKPIIVAYLLLGLLCIYLTGSRRAYIGVAFLSVLLAYRSRHRWSLLAIMAVLGPVIFLMMRDDLQTRLVTLFDSSAGDGHAKSSAQFRWQALVEGWKLFQRYPFTGTGPATFATATGCNLQAHNVYAQTLSEMGLPGLISLVAMAVCFWLNAREMERIYKAHPWWQKDFVYHTGRSAWLAGILLLFMGMGGHNLFRFNWLWFAAFQIVAVHLARRHARQEAESARWYTPARAAQEQSFEYATA